MPERTTFKKIVLPFIILVVGIGLGILLMFLGHKWIIGGNSNENMWGNIAEKSGLILITLTIIYAVILIIPSIISSWKHGGYWLKGGILGIVSGIISILLALIFESFLMLSFPVIVIVMIVFSCAPHSQTCSGANPIIALFILGILYWFLIGAFIGWIYGKVKNRSAKVSN